MLMAARAIFNPEGSVELKMYSGFHFTSGFFPKILESSTQIGLEERSFQTEPNRKLLLSLVFMEGPV